MLTLSALKPIRIDLGLKRSTLAKIADIPEERLRELELRIVEPWFDEAVTLSRILNLPAVGVLIEDDWRTDESVASPLPDDVQHWRDNLRAPLALAMRIAIAFGFDDPIDLVASPLHRQLWSLVAETERHPMPGYCPACGADILSGDDHLPTCLGNNLLAPALRGVSEADTSLLLPARRVPRARSITAYGLKALREKRELLQRDVADKIDINANYYARLERGNLPLSVDIADRLAEFYGVDRSVVYARPDGDA